MGRKCGKFYSWTVLDDRIAQKVTDTTFFDSAETGVPGEITWFFGLDFLIEKTKKNIVISYEGETYNGYFQNKTIRPRRVVLKWDKDLKNKLSKYHLNGKFPVVQFKKVSNEYYVITVLNELNCESFIQNLFQRQMNYLIYRINNLYTFKVLNYSKDFSFLNEISNIEYYVCRLRHEDFINLPIDISIYSIKKDYETFEYIFSLHLNMNDLNDYKFRNSKDEPKVISKIYEIENLLFGFSSESEEDYLMLYNQFKITESIQLEGNVFSLQVDNCIDLAIEELMKFYKYIVGLENKLQI